MTTMVELLRHEAARCRDDMFNAAADRISELEAENESLRANNRGICKLADERVAEIHRLRLEVRALERKNALLRSGIDPEASYVEAFADGANLRTVGERVMDLSEDFGVPVC